MPVLTTAALSALGLSLLARRRRRRGALELDDLVLALTMHLALVGVLAVALASCGRLHAVELSLSATGLALLIWPWRSQRANAAAPRGPVSGGRARLVHTLVLAAIVTLGIGLRSPTIPAPLAGRDQGTYVLRAQSSLRSGGLGWTDPVLATAGAELDGAASPAGALDLLGLYPTSDAPWRRDRYDAAYRPGAYLGDREAGEVVVQFFHLHPTLLTIGALALGPAGIGVTVGWTAALWLACLACVVRRLWPRGPWAALALSLVACSPLAIWTGRTPLSENPMAALEWAALLAALRLRSEDDGDLSGDAWALAACLGAATFVRGNALLTVPLVLALTWLRPRGRRDWAPFVVLASLLASVAVHASTAYPYVHDELLRRIPEGGASPLALTLLALGGALGWIAIDQVLARARADALVARLLEQAPRLLGLTTVAAFGLWWLWRSAAAPGEAPFSRLDPAPILLGAPTLALAAVGMLGLAWRWRPRGPDIWLLALAAIVPATALLYAPRQLPSMALFYYGRYLVPELLPAAAIAAVAAIELGARAIEGRRSQGETEARSQTEAPTGRRRALALGLGTLAGLALLGSVAAPLLRHPQLRLRERLAAAEAIEWLAARVEPGAVLIAGGEGWHSGHTHNQVGGALALGQGLTVLPYRTREDAWISAWELLVTGPARRGEAPPPVYLLVNEAAHQISDDDGARVAILDDQLWAPFVIERAALLELFVHALTPVPDRLPTRVARHELRMALLRVAVDADALAELTRLRPGDAGLELRGGLHDDGRACVSARRALQLRVAPELRRGASHVVVVAGSVDVIATRRVPRWSVEIDGEPVAVEAPPGLRPHPRATLGPAPIPLAAAARDDAELLIEIRGVTLGAGGGADDCPDGRVAELILLPRERGGVFELGPDRVEARTLAPDDDLGHPIEPTIWMPGRSLSRHRPGTRPAPTLAGLSMVVEAGASLEFAPIDLPLDADGEVPELELRVTLARTHTPAGARLRIYAGQESIGELEVPAERARSWIGSALPWQPAHDRAALRVELHSPAGGSVELRDLALLFRREGVASRRE